MRFRRQSAAAEEAPPVAGEGPVTATRPREAAPGAMAEPARETGPGGMDEPARVAPGAMAEPRPAERMEPAGRTPEGAARPRRRGVAWRTRDAGAAAVGAAGAGVVMLARLVMTVAALIALLIALAIVLRDVDANPHNSIVEGIHEGANFFAGAFTGLIQWSGNHPKREITVNWGIALLAYLLVGAVIAGFIARIGRGGLRFERTRRGAAAQY
jgi:hypothetical protein